jgi:hypothetical protein
MMTSTFITMLMAGLLDGLSMGLPRIDNLAVQWWRPFVQILTSLDIKINQIAIHALTVIWLPLSVRRKYARIDDSGYTFDEKTNGDDIVSKLPSFGVGI